MILDRIANAGQYAQISNLAGALEYLAAMEERTPLSEKAAVIDGRGSTARVQHLVSVPREERRYEAHRAFIDIHVVLSGVEVIEVAEASALKVCEPYDAARDVAFYGNGSIGARCVLRPGDFLVCYPEDAHLVGVMEGERAPFTKLIIKVAV